MRGNPDRMDARRRGGAMGHLRGLGESHQWRLMGRSRLLYQVAAALTLGLILATVHLIPGSAGQAVEGVVLRALTECTDWSSLWGRLSMAAHSIPALQETLPADGTHGGADHPEFYTPLRGEIMSPFGWRDDPDTGEYRFHSGVDLAAEVGTTVRAAAEGTVDRVWVDQEYGLAVEIDHRQGFSSLYAHLAQVVVRSDDEVASGEAIGKSGDSGRVSGPHLHFEVRADGRAIDPLPLMKEGEE